MPIGITTIARPPAEVSDVNSETLWSTVSFGLVLSGVVVSATSSLSSCTLPCGMPSIGIRRALLPDAFSVTVISPALGVFGAEPVQPPTRCSSARAMAALPTLRWSASRPPGSSRSSGARGASSGECVLRLRTSFTARPYRA